MKRRNPLCCVALILMLAVVRPSRGWWGGGHAVLTRASVKTLPAELPDFFREGGVAIAHAVLDPDVARNRGAPAARSGEHPEHYLDVELLRGSELPASRYGLVQLCCSLGVAPEKVGFLPYAIGERAERLAVAFAEHRAWPQNDMIKSKCLVYAGILAHYVQDLCQPLHLTIHFDGRVDKSGSVRGRGVHAKVDGLIERLEFEETDLAKGQRVAPIDSLMPFVLREFEASRAYVDTIYSMADQLPAKEGARVADNVRDFASRRARHAVNLTARAFLSAWLMSENLTFEKWLDRDKLDSTSWRVLQ